MVREAERRVYGVGQRFRGRLHPIYARELLDVDMRDVARANGRLSTLERQRTRFGARIYGGTDEDRRPARSPTRKLLRQLTTALPGHASRTQSRRARGQRGVTSLTSEAPPKSGAAEFESAGKPAASRNSRVSTAIGSVLLFKRAGERASVQKEIRVAERKRKASVHIAATEFGLDEMKANMQARIADKGASELRIQRVEEKVDAMMPLIKSIDARLRAADGVFTGVGLDRGGATASANGRLPTAVAGDVGPRSEQLISSGQDFSC